MSTDKKDYIKVKNNISRPILSIYELSGTITSLAKTIYEDKSLQNYIKCDDHINDLINPAKVACELLFNHKFDAYLNRYSDVVKFSDMYLNNIYVDELRSYFDKQTKITNELILKSLDLTE